MRRGDLNAGAVLVVALLLVPRLAAAQVSGVVRSAAGDPVAGAVVDLWTSGRRVDRMVTPESGRFRFPVAGDRLVVRAVGFRPVEAPPSNDSMTTIILDPFAVGVAPLTADAAGSCPRGEDRAARDAWARAAARYAYSPDSLLLQARARTSDLRVTADRLGVADLDSTGYSLLGSSPLAWRQFRKEVARSGYEAPWFDGGGTWLATTYAQHFADSTFGALHRFVATGEPDRIRFCSRGRIRKDIEGWLHFAPDGSFAEAEWTYRNTGGWTGGSEGFAPPAPDGRAPLHPAWSVIWQRLSGDDYHQVGFEFRDWSLVPARGQ